MVTILLADGFEESEALVPADLLRRAGVEVRLAGLGGVTVTGGHGITVTADTTMAQISPDELDMLVLPGGLGGVNAILGSQPALALVQSAWDRGCYLAAICAAPTILAHLGISDRRSAVCYPGMEEEMGSAVVQVGTPVVVDGRMVTAEAAGSAFPFGLKLVELLRGAETADRVRHEVHYHF